MFFAAAVVVFIGSFILAFIVVVFLWLLLFNLYLVVDVFDYVAVCNFSVIDDADVDIVGFKNIWILLMLLF